MIQGSVGGQEMEAAENSGQRAGATLRDVRDPLLVLDGVQHGEGPGSRSGLRTVGETGEK